MPEIRANTPFQNGPHSESYLQKCDSPRCYALDECRRSRPPPKYPYLAQSAAQGGWGDAAKEHETVISVQERDWERSAKSATRFNYLFIFLLRDSEALLAMYDRNMRGVDNLLSLSLPLCLALSLFSTT